MVKFLILTLYLFLTIIKADENLPKITSDFFYKTKEIAKENKTGGR